MSVERSNKGLPSSDDIKDFLGELRESLLASHAHLLPLFDTFAQEARFARSWLATNLDLLPVGSEILEVGAGLMLLSCQLQREGFSVTALEPIDIGFSVFSELQGIVLQFAKQHGYAPKVIPIGAEQLEIEGVFDFAFSVNVMEHVRSVPRTLEQVGRALAVGGEYRFTCPNYWFPYEPHFNIPIIFSKGVTQRLFHDAIFQSTRVTDPKGTWESLNWINVNQIRRIVTRLDGLKLAFDSELMVRMLERVAEDPDFAKRRSAWACALIGAFVKLRIHRLARFVPATLQPIIDCHIRRIHIGGG
ncbi:MAG: methyltransferase domain-containing protein [Anaerolineales bacterium]|nr:methyltransferase domain-containing protein [Anaerolineales bacterium]